jgi:hypothetical protein
MSDHDFELPQLRTAGNAPPVTPAAAADVSALGGAAYGVNELAELVVDLLGATQLIPDDKLALVRGRARQTGSLPQALVEEGVASSDGIARMVAARHQLPLVDLAMSGVDEDAGKLIPLHVLERVVAIPFSLRGDVLHVAVADPANIHAIDELRLATRHPIELGIASREDILLAIRRLARASEASGARAILEEEEAQFEAITAAEDETDLEADDGVSDAPLVRLVNSIIFQAAEDGASDVHFEPLKPALDDLETVQYRARKIAEDISLALQGSLLVRHGHPAVAEAFLATRMGGAWGGAFGTMPTGLDLAPILERAMVKG